VSRHTDPEWAIRFGQHPGRRVMDLRKAPLAARSRRQALVGAARIRKYSGAEDWARLVELLDGRMVVDRPTGASTS